MKIKIRSVMTVLVCLLVVYIPYFPQTVNNVLKLGVELVLILYIVTKARDSKTFRLCPWVLVYWIVTTLSTFLNLGFSTRTLNALVTGCSYFLIFYLLLYFSRGGQSREVVRIIRKFAIVMIMLSDAGVILSGGAGICNIDRSENLFLIGNKFTVSYFHMFCFALLAAKQAPRTKKQNNFLFLFAIYSIVMCRVMDCTTGIVGCVVLFVFYLISLRKGRLMEFFSKPVVITAVFIISSYLLVCTDFFINKSFIYSFFKKYSHSSQILSGRLEMFAIALAAIRESPWIGYGINCTAVQDILTWGNAQNGLAKMLLDFGIIGTASFFAVFLDCVKKRKTKYRQMEYAFLGFLYGMIICSMVEINISGLFFMGLTLVKTVREDNGHELQKS